MATPIPSVPNVPHSHPAKTRIIHIGGGASGILTAYKARKMLKDYELVCYEKNSTIGGTWYENKYPGCACDIPAHIYTYPFTQNPAYTSFYANSDEIEAYFQHFYTTHNLQPFFRFNTEVLSAAWDEESGRYNVRIRTQKGEVEEDWCHVLINGSGFANKWKWPDIQGLDGFEGVLMHSAAWEKGAELEGRRVAVIGGGASSVQIVPKVQEVASHLSVYLRGPIWICPQPGLALLDAEDKGLDEAHKHEEPNVDLVYPDEVQEIFANYPQALLEYRRGLEQSDISEFGFVISGSDANNEARKTFAEKMIARIGPGHEELKKRLIPTFAPGCKRVSPAPGYLESLVKKNVTVTFDTIERITPRGIVVNGEETPFDVIVCATGFEFQMTPHFSLHGMNNLSIHDWWNPHPKPYLATTTPHFPNYFHIQGPGGNWAHGCALPTHEVQVEYAMKCIRKLSHEHLKALEVKEEPTRQLLEYFAAWHKQSVWGESCKSWYKNNSTSDPVMLWAGSMLHMIKTLQEPRFEDYDIRRWENGDGAENMWAFLGNGLTVAESEGRWADAVPYIRLEDTPYIVE